MSQESPISAVQAAKFIVQERYQAGAPVSNLEIQALLFFCQRDCLRCSGYPLFFEDILAYPFGPAVEEVYFNFCGYGAIQITPFWPPEVLPGPAEKRILATLSRHREESTIQLLSSSRRMGGAWQRTSIGRPGSRTVILPQFIERFG